MRYYKFVNEYCIEEYDKPYVCVDRLQISYPSAEILLMAEIKPLVVEEMPEYNEETQYVESYYVDADTEIIQKWRVCDIEVIEDEQVTDA